METINGVPVSDEMIQEWADEAERGYDVDMLRKRGHRPIGVSAAQVIPVRMDDSLVAALDQRAKKDGTSRSEVIRSAVRAFIV